MQARRDGNLAEVRRSAEDARRPRGNGSPKRIVLVVDDDSAVRASVADYLEEAGYVVLLASDGEEALRVLTTASPRPGLVVLDLKMPKVDGWTFRKQQMGDPAVADVPVVVVTGASTARLDGVAAVLRKPLRLPVLAKTIDGLLEEEEPTRGRHERR
ncbi:MAG: response regulator [Labilithrix sp.]|nr:response regulator [Labilithrix sp.]